MATKQAAVILIFSFILMFSGCVNYRYGSGSPAPAGRPAVNAPPPASYERQAPPPWAPAHGRRAKYRYRYYPSNRIYFDTGRRIYFYYRNGSWVVSAFLPRGIRLNVDDYVTLEMDSSRPYTFHREIRKKYPPGKNRKKGKKRDEYDDRYDDKRGDRYEGRYRLN